MNELMPIRCFIIRSGRGRGGRNQRFVFLIKLILEKPLILASYKRPLKVEREGGGGF